MKKKVEVKARKKVDTLEGQSSEEIIEEVIM